MQLVRFILPWHYFKTSFLKYCHFRGWFTTSIYGRKFKLFNFNTELETSLFWKKNDDQLEASLLCFVSLSIFATKILDVGANTGIFSIAAASTTDSAKIFAIEPNYSNFTALKVNVKRNSLPITCLNVAATSQNKLVTLWDFSTEISYSASLEKKFRLGHGVIPNEVFGVRLDQLFADDMESVILAKIDVESHEAEVLRGLSKTLSKANIQFIFVIEVIRDSVAQDISRLLPSSRFLYFQINEKEKILTQTKILKTFNDGMNYLIISDSIFEKIYPTLAAASIKFK